ncbi:unnamed protein product [Sympodiomycopsis kandeliae]
MAVTIDATSSSPENLPKSQAEIPAESCTKSLMTFKLFILRSFLVLVLAAVTGLQVLVANAGKCREGCRFRGHRLQALTSIMIAATGELTTPGKCLGARINPFERRAPSSNCLETLALRSRSETRGDFSRQTPKGTMKVPAKRGNCVGKCTGGAFHPSPSSPQGIQLSRLRHKGSSRRPSQQSSSGSTHSDESWLPAGYQSPGKAAASPLRHSGSATSSPISRLPKVKSGSAPVTPSRHSSVSTQSYHSQPRRRFS